MTENDFCEVLHNGKWNAEKGECNLPISRIKKIVGISGITLGKNFLDAVALIQRYEPNGSLSHIPITQENTMKWMEMYPKHDRKGIHISDQRARDLDGRRWGFTQVWREQKRKNMNEQFGKSGLPWLTSRD